MRLVLLACLFGQIIHASYMHHTSHNPFFLAQALFRHLSASAPCRSRNVGLITRAHGRTSDHGRMMAHGTHGSVQVSAPQKAAPAPAPVPEFTLQNATGHPFKLCLQFIVALAIKVAVIECSSMPKIGTRLEIIAAAADPTKKMHLYCNNH